MRSFIIFLLIGIGFTGALSQATAPSTKPEDSRAQWVLKMKNLEKAFSHLMPLVGNHERFYKKENRAKIIQYTSQLQQTAQSLHKQRGPTPKPSDPSLEYVAQRMQSHLKDATGSLKNGKMEEARTSLQRVSQYCFSCHSQTSSGAKDLSQNLNPEISQFHPIEKANYHVAVRRFDKALNDFDHGLIQKSFALENPKAWELASKKSLAIAVRVKQDPHLALELISRLFDKKSVPAHLTADVLTWRRSVEEWIQETKTKPDSSLASTQKLTKAKALYRRGIKKAQASQPHQGLIEHLRASALLNDVLSESSKKTTKEYGQALYYSGLTARALSDLNLWTLEDIYFARCGALQKGTPLGNMCAKEITEK